LPPPGRAVHKHPGPPLRPSRFLTPYQDYAATRTDAPPIFHEVLSHALVGIALGRTTTIPFAGGYLYPNLWIALVGPPSAKKSTALSMAARILRLTKFQYCLAADSFSYEGFLRQLDVNNENGSPWKLAIQTELRDLLSTMTKDYGAGLDSLFMGLSDCPPFLTRALSKEQFVVDRPFLSLAGGLTPDGFTTVVREEAFGTGFLARFLFIPSVPTDQLDWPPGPDDDRERALGHALQTCVVNQPHDLQKLLLSDPAKGLFIAWQRSQRHWGDDHSDLMGSVGTKLQVLPLRLALTFHADRDPSGTQIDTVDMEQAVETSLRWRDQIKGCLTQNLTFNYEERNERTILKILKASHDPLTAREIQRRGHIIEKYCTPMLATLREQKLIVGSGNMDNPKKMLYAIKPPEPAVENPESVPF